MDYARFYAPLGPIVIIVLLFIEIFRIQRGALITEVRNVHLQRFLLQLRIIVTIRILVFFVQDFHIILLRLKIKSNVFCLTFGTCKSPRLSSSTIYFTEISRIFRIYIITTFNSPLVRYLK